MADNKKCVVFVFQKLSAKKKHRQRLARKNKKRNKLPQNIRIWHFLFFFSLSATTVSSLSKMCITYSFSMTTNLPWLQKKLSPVLKIVVVAKSSEVTRFFSTAVHFELRELWKLRYMNYSPSLQATNYSAFFLNKCEKLTFMWLIKLTIFPAAARY